MASAEHGLEEEGKVPSPPSAPAKASADAESGVTRSFLLASDGTPPMPCHPARVRTLLSKRRAVCVRRVPFAVRLLDRCDFGGVQRSGLGRETGPEGLDAYTECPSIIHAAGWTPSQARVALA